MIHVRTTFAPRWTSCLVDPRCGDGHSFGVGHFLLSTDRIEDQANGDWDVGYITEPETPPVMRDKGYKDCFHYDVEATFTRKAVPFKYSKYYDSNGRMRYQCTLPDGSLQTDVVGWCHYGDSNAAVENLLTFDGTYWVSPADFGVVHNRYLLLSVRHDRETGKIIAKIRRTREQVPYDWIRPQPAPKPMETSEYEVDWTFETQPGSPFEYKEGPSRVTHWPAWYWELPGARRNHWYESLCNEQAKQYTFGDLSYEAAESVRPLDINGIMYLKDFAAMGTLAKGLTALSRPLHGVKSVAKAVAGTYLASHYGLRLTVADTEKIAANCIDAREPKDWPTQRIGAQHHMVIQQPGDDKLYNVELRLSAEVDTCSAEAATIDDRCRRLARKFYELDLAPSLENIWDMIPFSFVVDWFAPVGDAASWLEDKHYLSTFKVQKAFYTRKVTWASKETYTINGDVYEGSVSYKIYDRYCDISLAVPPLRVDTPKGVHRHFVEATALVIANIL